MEGDISYRDYVDLRMRYFGGGNRGYFNDDFRRKIGKVNLLPFDGSGVITAWSWVLKVDTYFQLNRMPEEEAIKFVALHLEGVVHEWWHHGLVTLGHNQVTSYIEFAKRLIDRFDGKDPKLNFKDLAQVKQISTVDNYVTEFQRLSILVTDISERHRIVLFMDGLREPLRGWIKGFNPCTLNEAIKKVRDMAASSSKTDAVTPIPSPQEDKDKETI